MAVHAAPAQGACDDDCTGHMSTRAVGESSAKGRCQPAAQLTAGLQEAVLAEAALPLSSAGGVAERDEGANDYFVPWHLPFHRAEASAAAALAGEADAQSASGGPVLDRIKGTVVFKRYYHLFEERELRGLGEQLAGVRVADVIYDKSNWCMVLQRQP